MFAAAKNGNVGSGKRFIEMVFLGVDRSVKKNFRKKLSKTLCGSKKGLYICTRLAIGFAEEKEKQVH